MQAPVPPGAPQSSSFGDPNAVPGGALPPSTAGNGGGWGGAAGEVGQGGQGNPGQYGTVSSDTNDPNKALNDPRWQGDHGWEG